MSRWSRWAAYRAPRIEVRAYSRNLPSVSARGHGTDCFAATVNSDIARRITVYTRVRGSGSRGSFKNLVSPQVRRKSRPRPIAIVDQIAEIPRKKSYELEFLYQMIQDRSLILDLFLDQKECRTQRENIRLSFSHYRRINYSTSLREPSSFLSRNSDGCLLPYDFSAKLETKFHSPGRLQRAAVRSNGVSPLRCDNCSIAVNATSASAPSMTQRLFLARYFHRGFPDPGSESCSPEPLSPLWAPVWKVHQGEGQRRVILCSCRVVPAVTLQNPRSFPH